MKAGRVARPIHELTYGSLNRDDGRRGAATKPIQGGCRGENGMDSTMNSLPTQAILGAGTAVLAATLAVAFGSVPFAMALISASIVAYVAFAAQSERLRGEERLVYRPVYVRREDVQRRVSSDD